VVDVVAGGRPRGEVREPVVEPFGVSSTIRSPWPGNIDAVVMCGSRSVVDADPHRRATARAFAAVVMPQVTGVL
jgi:hypothetical protein